MNLPAGDRVHPLLAAALQLLKVVVGDDPRALLLPLERLVVVMGVEEGMAAMDDDDVLRLPRAATAASGVMPSAAALQSVAPTPTNARLPQTT